MRFRAGLVPLLLLGQAAVHAGPADTKPAPAAVTAVALPGAPPEGVLLDYLAIDRAHHRVWVPAGGTGRVDVIDTETQKVQEVDKFPTKEIERQGQKRLVGPSSATVGDGYVYIGSRADSAVCPVEATTLVKGECVTIPSTPDGLAYMAKRHEVWVTTPRDNSIYILDVSTPAKPKIVGNFTVDGKPEGYAVDDTHGFFYTNLEDKDKTLRIDAATRKVTATWLPTCGQEGPKGLALDPGGQFLVVACSERVEIMDVTKEGKILSKLETGDGIDNIDYVPSSRLVYAAAADVASMTVAHLEADGSLKQTAKEATTKGARNAVATDQGVAYLADGREGKILVVGTKKH